MFESILLKSVGSSSSFTVFREKLLVLHHVASSSIASLQVVSLLLLI